MESVISGAGSPARKTGVKGCRLGDRAAECAVARLRAEPHLGADRHKEGAVPFVLYSLIISAVFALYVNYRLAMFRRGKASQHWPTVEGTVIWATAGWEAVGFAERIGWAEGAEAGHYRVRLEYEYAVSRKVYRSRRIAIDSHEHKVPDRELSHGIEAAKQWYHKGDKVVVRYDPDNPGLGLL